MGRSPDAERRRVQGALVLSLCAGMVDSVGALSLDHTLLANMSGNTVHLATALASGTWDEGRRWLWALAGFVLGLMVTGLTHEVRERRGRRWLARVLLGEAALLASMVLLARYPGVSPSLLVVLGATAMGMQNASLRRAAGASIFTTHVTGTMTKMSESLVHFVLWLQDAQRQAPPPTWRGWRERLAREPSGRTALLMAGLWALFLLGALLGAVLHRALGLLALVPPCVLLVLLALALERYPLEPGERAPP